VVEIAQGDDSLVLTALQVGLAHSSNAHRGDSKRVARSLVACASEDVARNNEWGYEPGRKDAAPRYAPVVSGTRTLGLTLLLVGHPRPDLVS
jgi:hypothetical protein